MVGILWWWQWLCSSSYKGLWLLPLSLVFFFLKIYSVYLEGRVRSSICSFTSQMATELCWTGLGQAETWNLELLSRMGPGAQALVFSILLLFWVYSQVLDCKWSALTGTHIECQHCGPVALTECLTLSLPLAIESTGEVEQPKRDLCLCAFKGEPQHAVIPLSCSSNRPVLGSLLLPGEGCCAH